jgi:hypothetical protein
VLIIPANRTLLRKVSSPTRPASLPAPTDRKIGSPASRASGIIAGRHSYGPPCPHPAPRPHKGSRAVSCAHFRRRRPSPADEVGISSISVAHPLVLSRFARPKSVIREITNPAPVRKRYKSHSRPGGSPTSRAHQALGLRAANELRSRPSQLSTSRAHQGVRTARSERITVESEAPGHCWPHQRVRGGELP